MAATMDDLIGAMSGKVHVSQDGYDLNALQEYLAATIALPNNAPSQTTFRPLPPSRSASSTRKHLPLNTSFYPDPTSFNGIGVSGYPSPALTSGNAAFWNSAEDVTLGTPQRPGTLRRSSSYGFGGAREYHSAMNGDTYSFQNDAFAPMYQPPPPQQATNQWGYANEKANPWAGFSGTSNAFGYRQESLPVQQVRETREPERQERQWMDDDDDDEMDEEWNEEGVDEIEEEEVVEQVMGLDRPEGEYNMGYGNWERGRRQG